MEINGKKYTETELRKIIEEHLRFKKALEFISKGDGAICQDIRVWAFGSCAKKTLNGEKIVYSENGFKVVDKLEFLKGIEGFPIEIDIYGMKKDRHSGNYHFSGKEALRNPEKIHPEWLKVLRAIIDMKFTIPVSITLDSDGCYHAISVKQIDNNIFSHPTGGDNFVIFRGKTGWDFGRAVLPATKAVIQYEIVRGLKRFLEKIPEKTNITGYTHRDNGRRVFQTYFCPKPNIIQVVK